jgi:hypothetical protein
MPTSQWAIPFLPSDYQVFKVKTMNKNTFLDCIGAILIGLMLAFFLFYRG